MSLSINSAYKDWLRELKANIKKSQIKASLAVNSELIQLYWNLGKQIVEKQEYAQWGSGFIDQLSKDLKEEFPNMGGFSAKNLRYCKAFYAFYGNSSIWQQLVAKLESIDNQDIVKVEQLVPKLQPIENTKQFSSQLENQLFNIPWGIML
jgi:predicted nuclease of restriction endonuclease-like (RecB) superfamily